MRESCQRKEGKERQEVIRKYGINETKNSGDS